MKLYKFIGTVVSILTNPILRLLLKGSTRAYLLIIVDGHLLAVKTVLSVNLKHEWHLPGGGVRSSENLKSALIRELKEELGLSINSEDLLLNNQTALKSRLGFDYYVFSLKDPKKLITKPNKLEIIEARWLEIDDLSSYPCSDELKKSLKTV